MRMSKSARTPRVGHESRGVFTYLRGSGPCVDGTRPSVGPSTSKAVGSPNAHHPPLSNNPRGGTVHKPLPYSKPPLPYSKPMP